jgi:hypothetical protein
MARRERIKAALLQLIEEGTDYYRIERSIRELRAVFFELTGIGVELDMDSYRKNSELACGVALGPELAAHCLLDLARTKKFLQGVHRGILEARKSFAGDRLHVVYAGTGPYAPLALPFTTLFSPSEIRFTLIDIHEASIAGVRKMIEGLGLEEYVQDLACCDATAYAPTAPVHLLISETMQRSLAKEPQVAIARHLAPYLVDGGIMIPRRVRTRFCLLSRCRDAEGRVSDREVYSEELFELSLAAIEEGWEPVVVHPPRRLEGQVRAAVLTEIEVFDGIGLGRDESSLTMAWMPGDLNKELPDTIAFSYQDGPMPGIRYR